MSRYLWLDEENPVVQSTRGRKQECPKNKARAHLHKQTQTQTQTQTHTQTHTSAYMRTHT